MLVLMKSPLMMNWSWLAGRHQVAVGVHRQVIVEGLGGGIADVLMLLLTKLPFQVMVAPAGLHIAVVGDVAVNRGRALGVKIHRCR